MSLARIAAIVLIWIAGLLTIIASSITDEDEVVPVEPVDVEFSLATGADPLERELETRSAALDNLRLNGIYSANEGDKLTLDRSSVTLDTTSQFDITVTAKTTDELLAGMAAFDISAELDVGVDRDPQDGAFEIMFEGTTTIVTVTSDGVNVDVGGSATTESFGWSDFEAREDDEDEDLNIRMASAAYNMIEVVLRATLFAESIIDDVESNETTLEGMNLDTTLTLTCDNSATQGTGESRLLWTADASGTGEGEIGDGDSFEARYGNCRDAGNDRFLDGTVLLDNYDADDDTGLSDYRIDVEFRDVYVSETEVDIDTTPGASSPRVDGTLNLDYVERSVSSQQ